MARVGSACSPCVWAVLAALAAEEPFSQRWARVSARLQDTRARGAGEPAPRREIGETPHYI